MFESLKNSLRSILTYSNSSSTISQIFKIIFIKTFFEEYLDMEIFNITSIIALKLGKKSYFGCATLDTIVWKIIFKVWWGGSPDETRILLYCDFFLSNYCWTLGDNKEISSKLQKLACQIKFSVSLKPDKSST